MVEFQAFEESGGVFANVFLAMKPTFHPPSGGTLWAKVAYTWPLWPRVYWPMCILLHHAKRIGVPIYLCKTK